MADYSKTPGPRQGEAKRKRDQAIAREARRSCRNTANELDEWLDEYHQALQQFFELGRRLDTRLERLKRDLERLGNA